MEEELNASSIRAGRPLNFRHWQDHPLFDRSAADLLFCAHRSLTAMTLATHLEKHGLSWAAHDPGVKELGYWRRCFEKVRRHPPRVVALSTSFVMSGPWLEALCTLTHHEKLSTDRAVEAILSTRAFPRGYTFLVDATSTFPPKRWREILSQLIARGGAPHPLLAFARVTDLTEPVAELMSRAGVQEVFIGQESGDQRILDAMNKRTNVEHVPTAVRALGKHGIGAQFCFIHGFPGETTESLQATRSLLMSLNREFQKQPVVYTYILTPFHVFDFASISRMRELSGVVHPVGYDSADFSPKRAGEEVLATLIAGSQVPHAPVCSFLFDGQAHFLFTVSKGPRRYEIFRWLKAMERGVAIFLEHALDGKKPDWDELRRLRQRITEDAAPRSPLRRFAFGAMSGARARQTRRVRAAWAVERETGPSVYTRSFMAFSAFRDFGRARDAMRAWRTGAYPNGQCRYPLDPDNIDELSSELVREAMH